MGDCLHDAWQRFVDCFRTKTRDGSQYAYHYLSGLLRMKEERNFANIGRQTGVPGQNLQHFMSNSPWSAQPVFQRVQQEIKAKPGLERGGMLLLDESADEKAGVKSVGAARQYNGRMGKVDLSQVGVFLAYSNISPTLEAPVWTWVDGEVFLPEPWFSDEMAAEVSALIAPASGHPGGCQHRFEIPQNHRFESPQPSCQGLALTSVSGQPAACPSACNCPLEC